MSRIENRFRWVFLLALAAPLALGAGGRAEPSAPPGDPVQGFLTRGTALLREGSPARFFDYLNGAPPERAAERDKLVQDWTAVQEKRLAEVLEEGRFFEARTLFASLQGLYRRAGRSDRSWAVRLGAAAREHSYLTVPGLVSWPRSLNLPSPLPNLEAFHRLVGAVHVERDYRAELEVVRKDFPSFSGTGFLIDRRHVVTNFHVVERVLRPDTLRSHLGFEVQGQRFDGLTLKAYDALADLALLELPGEADFAHNFYELAGDVSALKQGQSVYTLGNHRGFSLTLTRGIVSSLQRRAPEGGTWLQIDANLSPGASGGLLIGEDRKIYGILVAGFQQDQLNFAIPINSLLEVLDEMKAGRVVRRSWLGALLRQTPEGPVFDALFPASPLGAWVKPGETRLVSLNGVPVPTVRAAQDLLSAQPAGSLAVLELTAPAAAAPAAAAPAAASPGGLQTLYVLTERRPEYPIFTANQGLNRIESLYPYFGFELATRALSRERLSVQGRALELNFYTVSRVRPQTLIEAWGVKAGDRLGLIEDADVNGNRTLRLLHLPQGRRLGDLNPLEAFIYVLQKGRTDENLL